MVDVWGAGRIVATRVAPEDFPALAALFALPETTAHRPDPTPDRPEASHARLARDLAHWRAEGFGRWRLSVGAETIGFGGLTRRRGFDGLNLSFHLLPAWRGQGLATAFADAAVSLAFARLGADRVLGLARPANRASQRVLIRAGFTARGEAVLGGAPTLVFDRRRAGEPARRALTEPAMA